MIDLTNIQVGKLTDRFPQFELSYETISHTKVSSSYNIVTAIPVGKKILLWFTFYKNKDVCYIFELNKEKRITKGKVLNCNFDSSLSLGTVLYGSVINNDLNEPISIIIDNIIYFKGLYLQNTDNINKLHLLQVCFSLISKQDSSLPMHISNFWDVNIDNSLEQFPNSISSEIFDTICYPIHHIQYRCSHDKKPFVNIFINKKLNVVNLPSQNKQQNLFNFNYMPIKMSFHKSQYKYPTIFLVSADIQFDVYHLFAYGKNNQKVYYNIAYIPDYKTSVFMNKLFRNIRENDNLDYIEESDTEEDFQNMNEDKYVDVNKVLYMECCFNRKFKKWVPNKVIHRREKVAHISLL